MPEREWFFFVKDILESLIRVFDYTKGMSQKEFLEDHKTYDAVMRNIEIIGEAVKHIPSDIKEKYNDIEWKKFYRLRNIVIHEYFGVDDRIVWDIVQNKLPPLKKEIEKIIKETL